MLDQQTSPKGVAKYYMDILFPKLLCQALRQRSQTKFSSSKCTRRRIPPHARCRAREDQGSSGTLWLLYLILLERQDSLTRESKPCFDVG